MLTNSWTVNCSSGHQGYYKHVTATVHLHLRGYWKIPFNCQIIGNLFYVNFGFSKLHVFVCRLINYAFSSSTTFLWQLIKLQILHRIKSTNVITRKVNTGRLIILIKTTDHLFRPSTMRLMTVSDDRFWHSIITDQYTAVKR